MAFFHGAAGASKESQPQERSGLLPVSVAGLMLGFNGYQEL